MAATPEPTQPAGDDLPGRDFPIDLNALFAAMSDIVVVIDRAGTFVWGAPTIPATRDGAWERNEWLLGKSIRQAIRDPQLADEMLATVHRALDTGETQHLEYHLTVFGDETWLSAAASRLSEDLVLWVARDITERVKSQHVLEERVDERTRELSALLGTSRAISSAITFRRLVEVILDEVKTVIDYTGASVLRLNGEVGEVFESRGPGGREDDFIGLRVTFPLDLEWLKPIRDGVPVVINDMHGDSPEAKGIRYMLQGQLSSPSLSYVRAFMLVPLIQDDNLLGILTMSKDQPDFFTDDHVRLATAVASHAAIVSANATLFEETESRAREMGGLLDTSRAITSTLALGPLMEVVLDNVRAVVDYDGAALSLEEGGLLKQVAVRRPEGYPTTPDMAAPAPRFDATGPVWDTLNRGEAIMIEDVEGDSKFAHIFRHMWGGELRGTTAAWVRSMTIVPIFLRDQLIGSLNVGHSEPNHFNPHHAELLRSIADQAASAIGNARLFEESQRTGRERAVMLEVSRAVASKLELQPLLETILDQLRNLVPYAGASVNLVEGDTMRQVVVRRPRGSPVTEEDTQRTFSIERMNAFLARVNEGGVYLIDDVHGETEDAIEYRALYGGDLKGTPVEYIRSFLNLPLVARDRVVGILSIAHDEPGFLTARHVELIRPMADQAAIAIDNSRLYEEARSSARETAALLEVSRAVASSLDIGDVITAVLDQLGTIIDNTGSSLLLIKDDALEMTGARSTAPATAEIGARIPIELGAYLWDAFGRGEAVIIEDVRADNPLAESYRASIRAIGRLDQAPFNVVRSWMGVPLIHKDDLIGMVTLSWTQPSYFTEDHARLARAFADQAAIAIENARLYEHGQSLAAVEERQRLARELHDSVSQALYGIALGARTARTQLDRDPAKVVEPLEYVLSLAEAGLAEMRALIFELRPESLETEGLVAAIGKQTSAVKARYGIEIDFAEPDEPVAPLDIKETAYRIAQEALHNVVKHARATSVSINLAATDGSLNLTIADNGAGFDPNIDYAGHLGLKSMRERAEKAGGTLDITSAPGQGSVVSLQLPVSGA